MINNWSFASGTVAICQNFFSWKPNKIPQPEQTHINQKLKKKTPLKRNLKSSEKTSYKEFTFWVANTDPLSSTKNPFKHKPSMVLLNNVVVELLLIELNNLAVFSGRFREEWFILFIFIFCSFVTQWCILSILIELEQVFEMFQ